MAEVADKPKVPEAEREYPTSSEEEDPDDFDCFPELPPVIPGYFMSRVHEWLTVNGLPIPTEEDAEADPAPIYTGPHPDCDFDYELYLKQEEEAKKEADAKAARELRKAQRALGAKKESNTEELPPAAVPPAAKGKGKKKKAPAKKKGKKKAAPEVADEDDDEDLIPIKKEPKKSAAMADDVDEIPDLKKRRTADYDSDDEMSDEASEPEVLQCKARTKAGIQCSKNARAGMVTCMIHKKQEAASL